jgi:hypothetical protein
MSGRGARTVFASLVLVGVGVAAHVAAAAPIALTSQRLTVDTATVSIPSTTCTLTGADADSYVYELSLLSNFGSAANLDVRSQLLGNKRTFVQFGLAPCAIPANALVTAASLDLTMFSAPSASRSYDARRVTGVWTETGVTWANQPAVAASATATVATGTTANVVLFWNVTADTQAFVDGTTNAGWRIADQAESSLTSREGQFRSTEFGTASAHPKLTITYYP